MEVTIEKTVKFDLGEILKNPDISLEENQVNIKPENLEVLVYTELRKIQQKGDFTITKEGDKIVCKQISNGIYTALLDKDLLEVILEDIGKEKVSLRLLTFLKSEYDEGDKKSLRDILDYKERFHFYLSPKLYLEFKSIVEELGISISEFTISKHHFEG